MRNTDPTTNKSNIFNSKQYCPGTNGIIAITAYTLEEEISSCTLIMEVSAILVSLV